MSVLDLIGNTPLIKLNNLFPNVDSEVFAKMEMLNPSGSVKDRAAWAMIKGAEENGKIKPGDTIIEYTSGNLGISLAMIASVRGYKCVLVTNNAVSREKLRLMKHFGAKVVIGDALLPRTHHNHPKTILEELVRLNSDYYYPDQYTNQLNPNAHFCTTGPEIWEQMFHDIDYFVGTIGTGGTISGIGKYLKLVNSEVKVIGVDPVGSILGEYFETKAIGEGRVWFTEAIGQMDFIPQTTHFEYVDNVVKVTDFEALSWSKNLVLREGINAGWSSGSAIAGTYKLIDKLREKRVVVLLPDNSDRYLLKFLSWNYQARVNLVENKLKISDILKAKEKRIVVKAERWERLSTVLKRSLEAGSPHIIVTDEGKIIGKIEQTTIIKNLEEDILFSDYPLEFLIEEPYPILDVNDPLRSLVFEVKKSECVIIINNGEPMDLVCRSDLVLKDFIQDIDYSEIKQNENVEL